MDLYQHRLGMYLARQIVEAHGGKLSIVGNRGMGLTIKIQVPLASEEDYEQTDIPLAPVEEDQSSYKQPSKGLIMTVLESQSHFLTPLYPEIRANSHEIILESQLDDVMMNLKVSKIDIILLEIDRANTGLVGQIQRIRSQSEVPIVIISLPSNEDKCLEKTIIKIYIRYYKKSIKKF